MGEDVQQIVLINLGCGDRPLIGWINVDKYGTPDVKHDLNEIPYPWDSDSVDGILASHIFEHLDNWWGAFVECSRILRPGGILEIRVPDESSSSAGTYRDHVYIFNERSFYGIEGTTWGSNSWAKEQERLPLRPHGYEQVPFKQYNWIPRCILRFLADHMRNFIWEQRFLFQKIKEHA